MTYRLSDSLPYCHHSSHGRPVSQARMVDGRSKDHSWFGVRVSSARVDFIFGWRDWLMRDPIWVHVRAGPTRQILRAGWRSTRIESQSTKCRWLVFIGGEGSHARSVSVSSVLASHGPWCRVANHPTEQRSYIFVSFSADAAFRLHGPKAATMQRPLSSQVNKLECSLTTPEHAPDHFRPS
jgi:hypothetical protein